MTRDEILQSLKRDVDRIEKQIHELQDSRQALVQGMRAEHDLDWVEIGRVFGISKQAAHLKFTYKFKH